MYKLRQNFHTHADITVSISHENKTNNFNAGGFCNFGLLFEPTDDIDIMSVQVCDIEIRVTELDLPFFNVSGVQQPLVDYTDLDLSESFGVMNIRTHKANLRFTLLLDPRRKPWLKDLGLRAPKRITIHESGEIDLANGSLHLRMEKVGPVNLTIGDQSFSLLFEGISNKCGRYRAKLCLENEEFAPPPAICIKDMWICAGQRVRLVVSTTMLDEAEIDQGVGMVHLPNDTIVVTPKQDTHYRLSGQGNNGLCNPRDEAYVWVVNNGDTHTIQPNPKYLTAKDWVYEYTCYPYCYAKSIRVKAIRYSGPKTGAAATLIYHDPWYNGQPFSTTVTSLWAYIDTPLVGVWTFVPNAALVDTTGSMTAISPQAFVPFLLEIGC